MTEQQMLELCAACARGDCVPVRQLLGENPELINQSLNEAEETPLHIAVSFGHLSLFQMLLDLKADVNAESFYHNTPLDYARMFKQPEMYKILEQLGAIPRT